MNKITVCIFGAEKATRAEIIAAVINKLDKDKGVTITGRFISNSPNLQEVEKETGQIRMFLEPTGEYTTIETDGLGGIKAVYRTTPDNPTKILRNWTPYKGERVACYQEGDRVYKVLPFHTATNGNFSPTERYYDHIRHYSGQTSMRVSSLMDEPEYRG